MPAGVPVGTMAIGRAGAVNAALLAAAIVARRRPGPAEPGCEAWRAAQTERCWLARPRSRVSAADRTVGILGGGQLGRMLALAGVPLGIHCVASSRRATRRRRRGRRHRRRPTTIARGPGRAGPALRRRHHRGRACAGRVAGLAGRAGAGPPVAEVVAVARTDWPRSSRFARRHRHRAVGARRRPSAAHGAGTMVKRRTGGFDGRGQVRLAPGARPATSWPPPLLDGAVRRRGRRALRAGALDRGRAQASTAPSRATRWSRTATATASCATTWPPPRAQRPRPAGRRPRPSSPPCWTGSATSACWPSSCSSVERRAAGQRDGAPRPQLRALDHRGRDDEPVRAAPPGRLSAARSGRVARCAERDGQPDRDRARPRRRACRARAPTCTVYGKAPRPARKVGHVTVPVDDERQRDERLARVRALLAGERRQCIDASRRIRSSVRGWVENSRAMSSPPPLLLGRLGQRVVDPRVRLRRVDLHRRCLAARPRCGRGRGERLGRCRAARHRPVGVELPRAGHGHAGGGRPRSGPAGCRQQDERVRRGCRGCRPPNMPTTWPCWRRTRSPWRSRRPRTRSGCRGA